MLSLPPVSQAGRPERVSRRKRKVDAAQAEPVERRERPASVKPVEDRRKGGRGRRREDQAQEAAAVPSRPGRPFAPLVAQLIATSIGAPQTRPRRRAAVQDAINAYAKPVEAKPRNGGSTA